jgi:hypothetical protein
MRALQKLRQLVLFDPLEWRLCSVAHPQSAQWADLHAFLGFATHYLREVVALLQADASSAGSTTRSTNWRLMDEATLVACAKHLREAWRVLGEFAVARRQLHDTQDDLMRIGPEQPLG